MLLHGEPVGLRCLIPGEIGPGFQAKMLHRVTPLGDFPLDRKLLAMKMGKGGKKYSPSIYLFLIRTPRLRLVQTAPSSKDADAAPGFPSSRRRAPSPYLPHCPVANRKPALIRPYSGHARPT